MTTKIRNAALPRLRRHSPKPLADLRALREHVVEHDGSIAIVGCLVDLLESVRISTHLCQRTREALAYQVGAITHGLCSLLALMTRLDDLHRQWCAGACDNERYRSWAALDIESWHVHVRSLLDHAARLMELLPAKPGQVPSASLSKLQTWLDRKPGNIARLGKDAAAIARSAPRFAETKSIRDQIVHHGALTLVYGGAGAPLLFQVHAGLRNLVDEPYLMHNKNVAYFKRYAALRLAELLLWLEGLGKVILLRPGVRHLPGARLHSPGISSWLSWLDELRAAAESLSSA